MYYLFIIRSNNSDYYIYIIIYSVKYYLVVYLNYNSMRSINVLYEYTYISNSAIINICELCSGLFPSVYQSLDILPDISRLDFRKFWNLNLPVRFSLSDILHTYFYNSRIEILCRLQYEIILTIFFLSKYFPSISKGV